MAQFLDGYRIDPVQHVEDEIANQAIRDMLNDPSGFGDGGLRVCCPFCPQPVDDNDPGYVHVLHAGAIANKELRDWGMSNTWDVSHGICFHTEMCSHSWAIIFSNYKGTLCTHVLTLKEQA